MNEYGDAVSFIDPVTDVEIKRLPGFYTPHFMRFSPDGSYGYVANIGAYHLTRVDLASLEIVDHIALDGFSGPPDATLAPDETGFADAQIDPDGMLYAAHNAAGARAGLRHGRAAEDGRASRSGPGRGSCTPSIRSERCRAASSYRPSVTRRSR